MTAAFTGLRQGELAALRWRDVDFPSESVRVVRSYTPGKGFNSPKGGEGPLGVLDCLVGSRSLLYPGETLWTAQLFDELDEGFSKKLLLDKRSFEAKLEEQLTSVSREAGRLMAEVLAVYE